MFGPLLAQVYLLVMAVFMGVATARDPFIRMAARFLQD